MTKYTKFDSLINSIKSEKKIKPKSLISTIYGDLAEPFGGDVWVDILTELLEPIGINNRLVRTSLFRLVEEGWLQSTRQGRKSFYSLTSLGSSQTRLAERLIYYRQPRVWNGSWTLVFLVMKPVDVEARSQLEQELSWVGFGKISHHVWGHPCIDSKIVIERIKELNLEDKVVCMQCENMQHMSYDLKLTDRDLAVACLPLDSIHQSYINFIETFGDIPKWLDSLNDSQAMTIRIILIDQYRKIVLHDPRLPDELLPANWLGKQAYELVTIIYNELRLQTDSAFKRLFESSGELLNHSRYPEFEARFSKSS